MLATEPVGGVPESLAGQVILLAKMMDARIATAESLTGGLLASALVDVSGASAVFNGGVVTYNTELKASILGVDERLLRESGPVHPRVAEMMAEGVRIRCAVGGVPATIGVATTGVAGPDSDEATGQPAGIVYLGVSSDSGTRHIALSLVGGRTEIRSQTVANALFALLDELKNNKNSTH